MQNHPMTSTFDRVMTLNRAIEEAFATGINTGNGAQRQWAPALDIVEQPDAYQVYAELPGVDRSAIDLNFEHNVLTIQGTKTAIAHEGSARLHAAERVSGKFVRSVRLPQFVDGDKISAQFTNGLLTVTIPKAKGALARKIELAS